jgi:hypothetical protein
VPLTQAFGDKVSTARLLALASLKPRQSRYRKITAGSQELNHTLRDEMLAGDRRFAGAEFLHVAAINQKAGGTFPKVELRRRLVPVIAGQATDVRQLVRPAPAWGKLLLIAPSSSVTHQRALAPRQRFPLFLCFESELNKAADGFRAPWKILLLAPPSVQQLQRIHGHADIYRFAVHRRAAAFRFFSAIYC